jgi:hypothetical protein
VRTFTGIGYDLELETVRTRGGVLRFPRNFHVDMSGAYCPGFYQTMLIPSPDLLRDPLDVRTSLHTFQAKIAEVVRREAGSNPSRLVRTSFAHVRRAAFMPAVIRALDGAD